MLGEGDCCVHLSIRAHNGAFLFSQDEIKQYLYDLLLARKSEHRILVHDYTFMDNHIHLILRAPSTASLSRFMQRVFGALACFVNKCLGRTGRAFGERARTPVLQTGRRFLVAMRYLSLNPVRAGMVDRAHLYRWSGYRHYAYGEEDPLIDDAPEYLGLSDAPALRRKTYQALSEEVPGHGARRLPEMSARHCVGEHGWVLGWLAKRGFSRPPRSPNLDGPGHQNL